MSKYAFDSTYGDMNLVLKALKRYNKKGLVYLCFTIFPLLRNGDLDNELVKDGKIYVQSSKAFEYIYGKIIIDYKVVNNNIYFKISDKLKYVLLSLYRYDSKIVDGIPIIDDTAMFKYNVYKSIINSKKED